MPPQCTCSICGSPDTWHSTGMCRRCYKAAWHKAHYVPAGPKPPRMSDCHPTRKHYARGLCSTCYKRWQYAKNPEVFLASNKAYKARNPEVHRRASARYRRANPEKTLAASARSRHKNPVPYRQSAVRHATRKRDQFVESVDVRVLWERDGGICQICRKPVDLALRWPHKLMATPDHIVPIAAGGEESYANTRLAHRVCNNARRDRGPAQMRLLG